MFYFSTGKNRGTVVFKVPVDGGAFHTRILPRKGAHVSGANAVSCLVRYLSNRLTHFHPLPSLFHHKESKFTQMPDCGTGDSLCSRVRCGRYSTHTPYSPIAN